MAVNREGLLRALEAVAPGLAQNRELVEQSACFVFRDGRVYTFNGELSCSHPLPSDGLLPSMLEGAVSARHFLELLAKMPDETVELGVTEAEVRVGGYKRKAGVRREKDIVLPLDKVEQPTAWKDMDPAFCEAVSVVQECAGQDEQKFLTTVIHIHPNWVEACDNFQLCRYTLPTGATCSMLVRQTAARFLTNAGLTQMAETPLWLHFKAPSGLVLSLRRYAEQYPDLSTAFDVQGQAARLPVGLEAVVTNAEIFSADIKDRNVVKVVLTGGNPNGTITIGGQSASGWYREQRDLVYNGPRIEFIISPKLLVSLAKRNPDCVVGDKHMRVNGQRFTYVTCLGAPEKAKAKPKAEVDE